jgi:hypothetical protein
MFIYLLFTEIIVKLILNGEKASGAGGLRGVDGLGQTAVARASMGPHSKTWVVIFFLRGGFLSTPDSAG